MIALAFCFWLSSQDISHQSRMMAGTSVTMTPQPSHSQGSNSVAEMNEVTSLSSLLTTEPAATGPPVAGSSNVGGGTVSILSGGSNLPTANTSEVVVFSKQRGEAAQQIGDCNTNSNKSSKSNSSNSNNHHQHQHQHHHSSGGTSQSEEKLTISAPLLPKNDKILEHNNISNK